jgi:hypothetical protein
MIIIVGKLIQIGFSNKNNVKNLEMSYYEVVSKAMEGFFSVKYKKHNNYPIHGTDTMRFLRRFLPTDAKVTPSMPGPLWGSALGFPVVGTTLSL